MESVDKLREWSRRYDYHWIDPKTKEMITFYAIDGKGRPSGEDERFSVNEGERMRELLDEIEREHQREVDAAQETTFSMPNHRIALPMDADGVPIHLGDEVYCIDTPEYHDPVEFFTLDKDGWLVDDCKPSQLRHWEAPAVDALLMQFVFDAADTASVTEMGALVDDYVERIREAIEHE